MRAVRLGVLHEERKTAWVWVWVWKISK